MAASTKLTPKKPRRRDWKPRFLDILSRSGVVIIACQGAGITRDTAYHARRDSPTFAAQWDSAIEAAVDILEAVAWKRAKANSDRLLEFVLKAHRREKYGDQLTVTMLKKAAEEVRAMPTTDLIKLMGYEEADESLAGG